MPYSFPVVTNRYILPTQDEEVYEKDMSILNALNAQESDPGEDETAVKTLSYATTDHKALFELSDPESGKKIRIYADREIITKYSFVFEAAFAGPWEEYSQNEKEIPLTLEYVDSFTFKLFLNWSRSGILVQLHYSSPEIMETEGSRYLIPQLQNTVVIYIQKLIDQATLEELSGLKHLLYQEPVERDRHWEAGILKKMYSYKLHQTIIAGNLLDRGSRALQIMRAEEEIQDWDSNDIFVPDF